MHLFEIIRQVRSRPVEERMEFLISLGMTKEQAVDFLAFATKSFKDRICEESDAPHTYQVQDPCQPWAMRDVQ